MYRATSWIPLCIVGLLATTTLGQSVGEEFPNFQAKDAVTGESFSLKDLRGQVVIVDFWATWCGPCVRELPNVKKSYQRFSSKGLEIVSISLDSDRSKFKSFVKKEHMNWLHVMDGGGWKAELAVKHNIHSIPAMFLVDANGKVIATGESLRGEGALDAAIEKCMKDVPPTARNTRLTGKAAKDLEAADKLYEKKEYAKAMKAYQKVAAADKSGETGKKASAKVKAMKADKDIAKVVAAEDAARHAPNLLKMAAQLDDAGKPDKAREYYQKVIEKYPDTEYAEQARSAMQKLDG